MTRNRWKSMSPILVTALVLLAAIGGRVAEPPLIEDVRNSIFDFYQRVQPREIKDVPVQVVDIDEDSLGLVGQWPWPRDMLAEMVERLTHAKAAVIAFDVLLSEEDRTSPSQIAKRATLPPNIQAELAALPDHDRLLSEAIARSRVVMGLALTNKEKNTGVLPPKYGFALAGDDPKRFLLDFPGALTSLESFDQAAQGAGAMNFSPDQDGVVRRVPVIMLNGGKIIPSLAAEALRVAQGESTYVVKAAGTSSETSFGAQTGVSSVAIGNFQVPTDANGRLWMYFGRLPERSKTPAWKVIREEFSPDTFQGKIVLVGASATGLLDLRFSPLGSMPGVEMQAQLIGQILGSQYIARPDWADGAEILFLLGLGVVVIALSYVMGPVWSLVFGVGIVLAAIAGSFALFSFKGLLLDPLYPSITAIFVFLSCSVLRHLQTEREGRWIRNAFSQYVSPNFVDELIRNPRQMELGGERRVLSFLFSDLAGFTPLVEQSEPGTLIPLLNEYLNEMVQIGFRHGGTLDAIVGDATAFFFNAPVAQPDHAQRAVACALEMDAFAKSFAAKKKLHGLPLGRTRIGVHTGPVIIGNMGGDVLFNYAAHGDAINTASRMEGVNKYLGTNVCISMETATLVPHFSGRPVGIIVLKGKTSGIVAFEPVPAEDMETDRVGGYLNAYDLVAAEDPAAIEVLQTLNEAYPDDPLIKFHRDRLWSGHMGPMIHMDEK